MHFERNYEQGQIRSKLKILQKILTEKKWALRSSSPRIVNSSLWMPNKYKTLPQGERKTKD